MSQVPRSVNNQADALSKLASSASCDTPRSVFWEVMEKRSIDDPIGTLDRSSTWMDAIYAYLENGTLLDSHPEKLAVEKRVVGFVILEGQLFKKAFQKSYLK